MIPLTRLPSGGTEKYVRAKTEKIQTYTERIAALSKQEEDCAKACTDLHFQLELLRTLQADRVRVLRMRFEENENKLTEDMLDKAQKLVDRLRASDIGMIASDGGCVTALADALGGERPGLQDFLTESNRKIEETMKEVDRELHSAGEGKDALFKLAQTQRVVSSRVCSSKRGDRDLHLSLPLSFLSFVPAQLLSEIATLRKKLNTYVYSLLADAERQSRSEAEAAIRSRGEKSGMSLGTTKVVRKVER